MTESKPKCTTTTTTTAAPMPQDVVAPEVADVSVKGGPIAEFAAKAWAYASSAAGKALLLAAVVALIVIVANIIRGPVRSTLVVPGVVPAGVVYSLPRTMFQIDVKAYVEGCRLVPKATDSEVVLSTRYEIFVAPVVFPDARARYIVDAQSLQHPFLSSDWDIKVSDHGLLSSVGFVAKPPAVDAGALRQAIEQIVTATGGRVGGQTPEQLEAELCAGLPITPTAGGTIVDTPVDGESEDDTTESVVGQIATIIDPSGGEVVLTPSFPSTLKLSRTAKSALAQGKLAVAFTQDGMPMVSAPVAPPAGVDGIVYRYPVGVHAIVCLTKCLNAGGQPDPTVMLLQQTMLYFGPGQEASLPFARGWLGERKVDMGFHANGGLSGVVTSGKAPETDSSEPSGESSDSSLSTEELPDVG
jgi:hypothetical protein